MNKMRLFCRIVYTIGGIIVVAVFIHSEWTTLERDLSIALNPLVHLGVILGLFFKPVFWAGLALLLIGHVSEMSLGDKE